LIQNEARRSAFSRRFYYQGNNSGVQFVETEINMFRQAKKDNQKLDSRRMTFVLRSSYIKEEQIHELYELAKDTDSLNPFIFSALLSSYGDQRKIDRAEILWDAVQCHPEASMNPVVYTTMMKAYSNVHQHTRVLDLFEQMKERGMKPTVEIYNLLLDICSKNKDTKKADSYLSEMKENGVVPSQITYSTMMNLHGRCFQLTEMIRLIDVMKKNGEQPKARAYRICAYHLAVSGEIERALDFTAILERMEEVSADTYSPLLDGLTQRGELEKVLALMEIMKKKGVTPSVASYIPIMRSLTQSGEMSKARELRDKLLADGMKFSPQEKERIITILGT